MGCYSRPCAFAHLVELLGVQRLVKPGHGKRRNCGTCHRSEQDSSRRCPHGQQWPEPPAAWSRAPGRAVAAAFCFCFRSQRALARGCRHGSSRGIRWRRARSLCVGEEHENICCGCVCHRQDRQGLVPGRLGGWGELRCAAHSSCGLTQPTGNPQCTSRGIPCHCALKGGCVSNRAQMMLRALNGSNSVYLAVLFTRGEWSRTRVHGHATHAPGSS